METEKNNCNLTETDNWKKKNFNWKIKTEITLPYKCAHVHLQMGKCIKLKDFHFFC